MSDEFAEFLVVSLIWFVSGTIFGAHMWGFTPMADQMREDMAEVRALHASADSLHRRADKLHEAAWASLREAQRCRSVRSHLMED